MGEGPGPAAVADAGPLIHLREIDRLPLLQAFSTIHIPDAVWGEAITSGRTSEQDLRKSAGVERHAVSDQQVAALPPSVVSALHRGEVECLALCHALAVPVLLTDDLDAREAAKALGVRPVGSVGLVLRAFRQGALTSDEARASLEHLHQRSSLFVTRAIIDLALDDLLRGSP